MRSNRGIRRNKRDAVLVLEMSIDELHEIEAHARYAGLSVAASCARTLLAGDRLCDHGVSVLATGAGACARCWIAKREIAGKVIELQPAAADVALDEQESA